VSAAAERARAIRDRDRPKREEPVEVVMLTEDGWMVLRGSIPRREVFAQAFGSVVERASATGYGDALDELLVAEVPA
jgi:hypothetical protein